MSSRLLAVAALLVGSLCASPSAMSYRRFKLYELVCEADLVVSGKILAVNPLQGDDVKREAPAPTFLFEVESTIAGAASGSEIEVRCFQNWTCAARWAPYENGQRMVLFLQAPPKSSAVYTILGAGDDGEMPLDQGTVYPYGYGVRAPTPPAGAIEARPEGAWRVPLAEFSAAVRGFRDTFVWESDPQSGLPVRVHPRENIEAARVFAASSPMAGKLFARVRSSSAWNGPVDPLPILELSAGIRVRRGENVDFRSRLCVIGDLDGDGNVDLAAGDPYDGTIINQHGALRILFLAADGSVERTHEVKASNGSFPSRLNEFAHLGEGVVPVGDIDHDGVPDLVVSAPGWEGSAKDRGGVWTLCLERDGNAKNAIELDADDKLLELGVRAGSGLGKSLAVLGDLDGDGFPEIAIGDDPEINRAEKDGRSVCLVSLGGGGVVRWARRIHDREGGFSAVYSWFGESLAGLGDVDGDGVPDLAVSNSYDSDGGELRGAVWIVCLNKDGTIKGKRKISDESGDFDGRLHDQSKFGHELYALGDIGGDGIPDLAASTTEGLWFLSLNRDGSVKESRVLPQDTRRESSSQMRILSLVRLPDSSATKESRFLLGGWVSTGERSRSAMQWFLGFDAKGQLKGW